MVIGHKDKTE